MHGVTSAEDQGPLNVNNNNVDVLRSHDVFMNYNIICTDDSVRFLLVLTCVDADWSVWCHSVTLRAALVTSKNVNKSWWSLKGRKRGFKAAGSGL